ncbi:uncharacterized protein BYT42DRAFT_550682 [Radiomyces spectabilis]|uniref:uncharacterized protein n=1 Tax=Radiomyces spectabilis TaxID=64574 RepID=UPI00221FCE15|nr:uncharacterized protein BYT42DRAFT_550682 [Radiomyces spectabilis]KAI8393332.1 hypothetical protein BYT42DRAFT_550682 [Radiomyces spectabilis]
MSSTAAAADPVVSTPEITAPATDAKPMPPLPVIGIPGVAGYTAESNTNNLVNPTVENDLPEPPLSNKSASSATKRLSLLLSKAKTALSPATESKEVKGTPEAEAGPAPVPEVSVTAEPSSNGPVTESDREVHTQIVENESEGQKKKPGFFSVMLQRAKDVLDETNKIGGEKHAETAAAAQPATTVDDSPSEPMVHTADDIPPPPPPKDHVKDIGIADQIRRHLLANKLFSHKTSEERHANAAVETSPTDATPAVGQETSARRNPSLLSRRLTHMLRLPKWDKKKTSPPNSTHDLPDKVAEQPHEEAVANPPEIQAGSASVQVSA